MLHPHPGFSQLSSPERVGIMVFNPSLSLEMAGMKNLGVQPLIFRYLKRQIKAVLGEEE